MTCHLFDVASFPTILLIQCQIFIKFKYSVKDYKSLLLLVSGSESEESDTEKSPSWYDTRQKFTILPSKCGPVLRKHRLVLCLWCYLLAYIHVTVLRKINLPYPDINSICPFLTVQQTQSPSLSLSNFPFVSCILVSEAAVHLLSYFLTSSHRRLKSFEYI